MFDVGFSELLVILLIVAIFFGGRKLPEIGRSLGKAVREFKQAKEEFRKTIEIEAPKPVGAQRAAPAPAEGAARCAPTNPPERKTP